MLFDQIPEDRRSQYLKELLDYVVERNGLASVPKQDMEACFVYLYKKLANPDADLYSLSKIFKIKEGRLKGLLELFYLKFEDADQRTDEEKFLDLLVDTQYEIESFEKVQISFHFNKIEAFQLLQQFFRKSKGAVKFDKLSESVVVNQNRLYDVLDQLWRQEGDRTVEESSNKRKIQKIIGNIGNSIDEELRNQLRSEKQSKFYKSLDYASKLVGIGSFVLNFYKSDPFKLFASTS